MKNKYISGAIVLMLATILAKLLGAIYRIPLSNLLGAEGMGVYQLAFPVYSFILLLIAGGLPVALSKLIADARAEKQYNKINILFSKSFLFCLVTSILFAVLLFFFADNIALLQGNIKVSSAYKAISVAVIFASLSACLKGFFQGFQEMLPTATSNILEQIIKLIFGLYFAKIFMDNGIVNSVFGAMLGIVIADVISFIVLISIYFIKRKKYIGVFQPRENTNPSLFKIALPISVGILINPFCAVIDSLLVVNVMSTYMSANNATALFGIQTGMVMPLVNLPIILCSAICVALLPNLAFALKSEDKEKVSTIINNTFMFVWCLILACSVGFIVLSPNILMFFYSNILNEHVLTAITLFIISSLSMIFLALAGTSTTILQSYGEMRKPMKNLAISSAIKILLTLGLIFIPKINIVAIAIANTISYIIYAILNAMSLKKISNYAFESKQISLPILCALSMGIVVFLVNALTSMLPTLIGLFICITSGIFVFVFLLFTFKILSVRNFVAIFKSVTKRIITKRRDV